MKVRLASVLGAGLMAGCWPHETRPLTESEARRVDRMCEAIAEHARRTDDPVDRAVSAAVEAARRDGRIAAFEDGQRPDGESKQGAVVCGRLYLHFSILDDEDSPSALMMLYHEGVHLTQSSCALIFSPRSAEDEAEERMRRFESAWRSAIGQAGHWRRYPEGATER